MDTVGGDGQIPRDQYCQTCPAGLKNFFNGIGQPSSKTSHFLNEATSKTFLVKMNT